jgi:ATP-dependent helicase/nuclease subunit B
MSEAILPSSERPWLAWAFRRNEVPKAPAAAPPRPCPPVEARPRRLSATDVETWIANPYAIYAKRILGLEPLRAAGAEPGGDMRGTLVHQALHEFVRSHPGALPSDSAARLMGILDRLLAEHAAHPRIAAFWRPRFARFAAWFAETEPERRRDVVRIVSEVTGKRFIEAPAGPFELTARADRIDVGERGLIITDYKTGSIPTGKEVTSNVKPQLPLEAAIALDGGFVGIAERRVAGLRFIRASGGEPPGAALDVNCDGAEAGRAALDGLHRLIGRFDDPSTPYHAARRAQFKYDYDHFAHLARIDEWSVGGGGDDVDEA